MVEIQFRNGSPERTYTGNKLSDYRGYKKFLVKDFKSRCGYTDCFDFWFGGPSNFQIDHFKPKSKYPNLETDYNNLVYSCSYVNRAKSDDDGIFLDPAEVDYNLHFYRDNLGNIYPREDSVSAKYMYLRLKLYLNRHSIIWMLDQLEQKMFRLQELVEATNDPYAIDLLARIAMKYNNYKRFLRAIQ